MAMGLVLVETDDERHWTAFDPEPSALPVGLTPVPPSEANASEVQPLRVTAYAAPSEPSAAALDRLESLLSRFETLEKRMNALEGRAPSAGNTSVGQLIPAPVGSGGNAGSGAALSQIAARVAAVESRMKSLGKGKRVKQLDGKLRKLNRRFKKAEAKVKVSQLTINQQVDLAVQSPLGRELINKIDELEDKLNTVLSKRMLTASSIANLIPGLWGTYYSDRYFVERVGVNVDPRLNFDWNRGGPETLNGQKDNFSVRWEGVLRISEPGTYSFYTLSDDGIRFWLGDQLVLAEYDDHKPQEDVVDLVLEPGDYPLRVEYYEHGGRAVARLLWKFGGNDRGAIPSEHLFHTLEQERM
jgi:hypothetical protein